METVSEETKRASLEAHQRRMFGMTTAELEKQLLEGIRFHELSLREETMLPGAAVGLLATSMLSDVQEMVERNMREEARVALNRVKWLLRVKIVGDS